MAWSKYDSTGAALEGALTDFPVGSVVSWAADSPPSGWLKCDGTAISRVGYPELFGVIGTSYGTGDGSTTFNLPTSDGEIILAFSMTTRLSINTPPQFVTALPATPQDGTEVYYGADTTSGAIWHLRFRSASAGPKWEYVGGSSLINSVGDGTIAVGINHSSTTYAALTGSAGPTITLPVPGDYIVELGFSGYSGNTGAQTIMSYDIGGTQAQDADAVLHWESNAAANIVMTHHRNRLKTALPATPLTSKYRVSTATSVYWNRYLQVTPVRVNAA